MNQLGVDSLKPSPMTLLDLLSIFTMQRPSLAARNCAVQHLANDTTRERQAIAARLALFLEQALIYQTINRVLNILSPGQRFQVTKVKGLANDRSNRKNLTQILGQ